MFVFVEVHQSRDIAFAKKKSKMRERTVRDDNGAFNDGEKTVT